MTSEASLEKAIASTWLSFSWDAPYPPAFGTQPPCFRKEAKQPPGKATYRCSSQCPERGPSQEPASTTRHVGSRSFGCFQPQPWNTPAGPDLEQKSAAPAKPCPNHRFVREINVIAVLSPKSWSNLLHSDRQLEYHTALSLAILLCT